MIVPKLFSVRLFKSADVVALLWKVVILNVRVLGISRILLKPAPVIFPVALLPDQFNPPFKVRVIVPIFNEPPDSVSMPSRFDLLAMVKVPLLTVSDPPTARLIRFAFPPPAMVTLNAPIPTFSPISGTVLSDQLLALLHNPSPASLSHTLLKL